MIRKLTGIVDVIDEESVILDVGGVGYHVHCPARVLDKLPPPGETLVLWVETHMRESVVELFGFLSQEDRVWFKLLQSVQGVGARLALAIMGTLDTGALARALAAADARALCAAPGVGQRLAQRITHELKDKAPKMGADIIPGPGHNPLAGAVAALVRLGIPEARAIESARAAAAEGAGDVESILRESLKSLSPAGATKTDARR